jgi:hypothetical protein
VSVDIPILGGVIKETRNHPYTMIALVGLLLGYPLMWTDKAAAGDVQQLGAQVQALQYTVTRASLENQLRSINTELFNLQQKVSELEIQHKRADQLYYDRINTLLSDKDSTARQLAALRQ